jgi:hypothetical protein
LDLPYLKQTSSASQAEAQNPELGHKATHVVTIELMTGSLERDGVLGRIGDDKIHGNVDHAVNAQLAVSGGHRADCE